MKLFSIAGISLAGLLTVVSGLACRAQMGSSAAEERSKVQETVVDANGNRAGWMRRELTPVVRQFSSARVTSHNPVSG